MSPGDENSKGKEIIENTRKLIRTGPSCIVQSRDNETKPDMFLWRDMRKDVKWRKFEVHQILNDWYKDVAK